MDTPFPTESRNKYATIAFLLFVAIGVARIISTYHIFGQTSDEPAHIVTGLEWLQRGDYTFEPLHPPLARVAVALGPYLSGIRLDGPRNLWEEGNEILFAHNRYLHNLALARIGVLPFFVIASFLVWYWARARYGCGTAVVATLLFTTCPVILAHSGLATTDMALAATFTWFLVTYLNWLEQPTHTRSAVLGIAAGLAIVSKFSALVFMPACGLALLVWRWGVRRDTRAEAVTTERPRWRTGLVLAALVMCVIVWAGYRFSMGSVTDAEARPHAAIDRLFGHSGILHQLAYAAVESSWVPAPAFFKGLAAVRQKEAQGHKGYLLGHIRETGWWYFYPVALAVKTPLAFLVLIAIGAFYLVKTTVAERNWITAAPVILAVALVLVCMPSRINIGIRHILPIFPLLAIIGGVGACRLWAISRPRYLGPATVLLLLGWQVGSSIRVHPDYLAYFNECAGSHPERILINSDLDWGQDLLRLCGALRQRHINEISIAYAGSARLDLSRFDLPPFQLLAPYQRTTGWVAISLLQLKTGGLGFPDDSFAWLEAFRPVALVGRSIRLYYIPLSATSAAMPAKTPALTRDSR